MPRKQVNFLAKAKTQSKNLDVEDWVQTRGEEKEDSETITKKASTPKKDKMKRLTLDISDQLHRTIKAKAVAEGKTMADMLRELLETTYN